MSKSKSFLGYKITYFIEHFTKKKCRKHKTFTSTRLMMLSINQK